MRLVAAVVLAGCSFQPRAAPGTGDAPTRSDAPGTSDGTRDSASDASSDAFVQLDGPTHPANWWNASWGSRMRLTIANTATTAYVQGYQVGLPLDLDAAPCTGNRDQVRIVYQNQTDIPRVIDEVGTTEWTWFPLQAQIDAGASSTDYWLYCTNANPSAALADPATVFDVWDDFAGTSLGAMWTSQNSVSVGSGAVTIGANGAIHSNATYGPNTAIDSMATASSASVSNPQWWVGYETTFTVQAPWVVWLASAPNQIHPSINETGTRHEDTASKLDTNPHLYGVENYGGTSAFRLADAIVDTHTNTSNIGALNLRLSVLQAGGTVSFDWVRVRKAVSPAPMVSVGTVETY
ncbi:MAG TPA: hypothetical protein VLT45_14880 [Kofleriaceae bacterium]|nr:hypothetical protein [Kofleriaceae bacterium]